MTGLGARDANYLYVASTAQNAAYRYSAPSIVGRTHYINFTASSDTRDIAVTPEGHVWVALDWSSIKVRHYDSSGQMLEYLGSDLVPDAWGVTMDDEGCLWVSDPENDLIYKVNLSTGVESGNGGEAGLRASRNPFRQSVTLSGPELATGTLRLYDSAGRLIMNSAFDGALTIDGTDLESGVYHAILIASSGQTHSANILRL